MWSPNIFVEICGTGEVVGPDDDLRLAIAAVTVENILHLFHFQDRDSTDDEDHKGGMLRWMTFLTRGESESTDQCESESGEGVGWVYLPKPWDKIPKPALAIEKIGFSMWRS